MAKLGKDPRKLLLFLLLLFEVCHNISISVLPRGFENPTPSHFGQTHASMWPFMCLLDDVSFNALRRFFFCYVATPLWWFKGQQPGWDFGMYSDKLPSGQKYEDAVFDLLFNVSFSVRSSWIDMLQPQKSGGTEVGFDDCNLQLLEVIMTALLLRNGQCLGKIDLGKNTYLLQIPSTRKSTITSSGIMCANPFNK